MNKKISTRRCARYSENRKMDASKKIVLEERFAARDRIGRTEIA